MKDDPPPKPLMDEVSHGLESLPDVDIEEEPSGRDEEAPSQLASQLKDEIADLQARMAAQTDLLQEELSRLQDQMVGLLTAVSFGNKALSVGAGLPFAAHNEMDAHAAILKSNPLTGSLENQHSRHLLIPIHVPKLTYLSSMFAQMGGKWDQERVRCTIIATSSADRELTEQYIRLTRPAMLRNYEVISAVELASTLKMHDLANAMSENRNGGIINMKKLLALHRAFGEGADEAICVDSDVAFLRPLDGLFEQAGSNYRKNMFIAVSSSLDITIDAVRNCASYFSQNDERKLTDIYRGNLFSWFFDIPYYVRNDTREFFDHISTFYGGLEPALLQLSWHHFDYILYMNYLILRGDFALRDVSTFVTADRLSDDLPLSDLQAVEDQVGLAPVWATLSAVIAAKVADAAPRFHALSHVDRLG